MVNFAVELILKCLNVKGIADCWVEGGIFDDESAKLLTGKPGYCVGKKKIRGTFRLMFLFKPKAEILKMYDKGLEMDYDIHIIGKTLPCHGKVEQQQDGKFLPSPVQDVEEVADAAASGIIAGKESISPCKVYMPSKVIMSLFPFVRRAYWNQENAKFLRHLERQKK